ncbi:MAG: phosphate regulon transcriptional regulator PhoB [Litorivicinus sp.]
MKRSVLIVDDETAIREMIVLALEMAGYETLEAADGVQALRILQTRHPDLILLDWMMPGASGLEVARKIRKSPEHQALPIVMLTAREDEDAKITGLSVADDFITKPFSPRELVARLKAILRRTTPRGIEEAVEIGGITLDPVAQRVFVEGKELNLSPLEFRLLQNFMAHPDRAFSREQLLDRVWGGDVYVEDRTVDVHIRRLRKALDEHGSLIETVRGTGYRFTTPTMS